MDAAGSITIAAKGVARKEEIEELDLLGRRRTHDEGCDRGDGEREVAAEVGVGQEGADDGGEAGGAVEPVEQRRGVHALHVEHLRQVHQQVRRRAQRPQLLERLVPCRTQIQTTQPCSRTKISFVRVVLFSSETGAKFASYAYR